MSETQTLDPLSVPSVPLVHAQLPRFAPALTGAMAAAIGVLTVLVLDWGWVGAVCFAWLLFGVGLPVWSLIVEGSRRAKDRLASTVLWSAFSVAMIPLLSLVWTVFSKGIGIISGQFFSNSMRGVLGEGGGIHHALIGTLIVTAMATAISVPIGVMTAIYLIEYGKGSRFARAITFLVDVMTGIPSIVAGLFAFALFVMITGDPGVRMGFGGAVALSVLMVPTVVRATEEMLKLVPDELREASYALGVPKWRTITKVVLPTAVAGIVTGVTLAIARVAGETAPLLIIAGFTSSDNLNPFAERMMTLPVFIYYAIAEPGLYKDEMADMAWGAALVLVSIVMTLNIIARVIGGLFAPKTGR
jgi:phosphate transport system permease protein